MRDEETAQYVDGMAYHWYFASGERLMDGSVGWEAVNRYDTKVVALRSLYFVLEIG